MEGLTGPAVKLTLYIKEGRGFGFLQNPIVIVARLCSNTLQTNIYPPVAEPQFHEELLWEVDKQTLRRCVSILSSTVKSNNLKINLNVGRL